MSSLPVPSHANALMLRPMASSAVTMEHTFSETLPDEPSGGSHADLLLEHSSEGESVEQDTGAERGSRPIEPLRSAGSSAPRPSPGSASGLRAVSAVGGGRTTTRPTHSPHSSADNAYLPSPMVPPPPLAPAASLPLPQPEVGSRGAALTATPRAGGANRSSVHAVIEPGMPERAEQSASQFQLPGSHPWQGSTGVARLIANLHQRAELGASHTLLRTEAGVSPFSFASGSPFSLS